MSPTAVRCPCGAKVSGKACRLCATEVCAACAPKLLDADNLCRSCAGAVAPPAPARPAPSKAVAPDPTPEAQPVEGRRVHVTGVDRWLECGFRAEQYDRGEWTEPARPEAIRGRAVHAAREHALKSFLKAGALPSVEDCVERAHAEVVKAVEIDDAAVTREEADPLAAEARLYAKADRLGVLPDLAPHVIEVETKIELPIEGDGLAGKWVLSGTPDAVARNPISRRLEIPDLKTSKSAPAVASVNASSQHSGYSALAQSKFGEVPAHSIQHVRVMVRGPRGPLGPTQKAVPMGDDGVAVVTSIPTDRTPQDVGAFLRRLRFVIDAREQGFAPPAPASFLSPCHRCPHRGAEDNRQRCPWVPATRSGEGRESDE